MKTLTRSFDATDSLPSYIEVSRYARYLPELKRRETWAEGVARVCDMHLEQYSDVSLSDAMMDVKAEGLVDDATLSLIRLPGRLHAAIRRAFVAVREKRVLPSMRSLQFGGLAVQKNNVRIFNCSSTVADRVEFFAESFYTLLCGCGVGFSVQKHHVAKLPALAPQLSGIPTRQHVIGDSIEGWAEALQALIEARIAGEQVEFDYSMIRPEGSPIRTSGGKAPGPRALSRAFSKIDRILAKAQGRQLRPIEVYDIVMHAAGAVLSGGIRRSATICLFSDDDEEMMNAKTGDWFTNNPQRAFANNSAVLIRGEVKRETFDKLFAAQQQGGEPGFFFAASRDYTTNPCCEIGMKPFLDVDQEAMEHLRTYGYKGELKLGQRLSGFSFCNLTTTNGALATSEEIFFEMCVETAIIGTLQAGYTKMPFLGPVTRVINEREALLGVSICGILDSPAVLLNPEILRTGAQIVKAVNAIVAKAIGIRRAARTTCVKPEGTASLLLGCSSGITPHHARRYFRRVQAGVLDPVYRHFKAANAHLTERSVYDQNGMTDVITFRVEAPEGALLREDLDAIAHLDAIRTVQENWVKPGTAYSTYSPGLFHNVSNTVTVPNNPDEWSKVANYIWAHQADFTGVALLSSDGETSYAQAPRQAVVTDEDVARWNTLEAKVVDYTTLIEEEDNSKLREIAACAGGQCTV